VAHMEEKREMHKVSVREGDCLEDRGVDRRMGSEWILGRLAGRNWIQLAQDRDWWQALVNTVMNFWVLVPQR
jgi:hypothetical protein